MSIDNLVRENIKKLQPYSSARKEFTGRVDVMLDANELPYGELNRYPDPQQVELKQIIGKKNGLNAANVFIGNGSDEIIDLLIRIFCEPGKDQIAHCTPTYGMYAVNAAINNVGVIEISLDENFEVDASIIMSATANQNCKILFLCSPNNPTGNSLANISQILDLFKGIVVVDEAYIDFSDRISLKKDIITDDRLVVLQTLSKSRGLAAARIGIAFAGESILKYLNKIKPPYNVSLLNQQAAVQAMIDEQRYEQNLNNIKEQKNILKISLGKCACVAHIYPSDANFFLVKFFDSDAVFQTLLRQGIVVRNRNQEVAGCLRISVGTQEENKKLINALNQIK